ncbi:hypothetical protein HI914_05784 [Erysiphe necator]|nr:hypothetical protein HI914_05784 [Erysiphe necator]
MPSVRAKRQFTILDIAKDRARSHQMEKALWEKDDDIPDIEMIDENIDKLIMQGLKDSQWATVTPEQTKSKAPALGRVKKSTNVADPAEVAVTHTRVINQQNVEQSEQSVTARNTQNIPEKAPEMHDNCRHNDFPPELRNIIQSEECRAAMIAANLKTYTMDTNKEFAQGLITYLRAAFAQSITNGYGSTPLVLLSRPISR